MDPETYDQIPISSAAIGDSLKFVKENEMCKICSHNGNVFAVEPPLFVELVITECEPGVRVIQLQVQQSHVQLRQAHSYQYPLR